MIKVKILGAELEADLLNPDTCRIYEENGIKVAKQSEESLKCKRTSDAIRMQCNAVMECLDATFGNGSAKKVLGGSTDLLRCLDAYADYCDIIEKYVEPLLKEKVAEARARAALKER